jgi:hypothetical protein
MKTKEVQYGKSKFKSSPFTKAKILARTPGCLARDEYQPGRVLPPERDKSKILFLLEEEATSEAGQFYIICSSANSAYNCGRQ